jgi:SAM-dependent methyltransferase
MASRGGKPFPVSLMRRVLAHLFRTSAPLSSLDYWQERARHHGARAVFNLGHRSDELAAVTRMQKDTIYPCLRKHMAGDERYALDLGCGTGRFTTDLAEMVSAGAVGVDPIQELLDLAPGHPRVKYRPMAEGSFPVDSRSMDLVWICLVLGGIRDSALLQKTVRESERVLRPGGLVLLVENTSDKPDGEHWCFRPAETYEQLFSFAHLTRCCSYEDLGEEISIFTGRLTEETE